jgi:hypothetical protein
MESPVILILVGVFAIAAFSQIIILKKFLNKRKENPGK